MNEKKIKNKEYKNFQVSYIGRNRSFLKKGENLTLEHCGKPLTEFISSDLTKMNGILFNEKKIDFMGLVMSEGVIDLEPKEEKEEDFFFKEEEEKKDEEVSILDSDIFLVVYTQCQINEGVLFFVWHFETQVVTESREAWEARYGLVPGACCLKNSCSNSPLEPFQELELSANQEALADVENKKCHFQNHYVACHATVFPHFVNPENPKAAEFLKNHPLNIPVNMDMTFGPLKDTPDFCYGGEKPGLCTSLYDSIIFELTYDGRGEHNLEKFFSDAIATCFLYQNDIKLGNCEMETIKHSFIGYSLYY